MKAKGMHLNSVNQLKVQRSIVQTDGKQWKLGLLLQER